MAPMNLSILFAEVPYVNRRPICPTFVHDDNTRLIILLLSLPILIAIHWAILRYFNVR
jgi:hypothetical protein